MVFAHNSEGNCLTIRELFSRERSAARLVFYDQLQSLPGCDTNASLEDQNYKLAPKDGAIADGVTFCGIEVLPARARSASLEYLGNTFLNGFLPVGDLPGCTSYSFAISWMVLIPLSASRATRALNCGSGLRRLAFISVVAWFVFTRLPTTFLSLNLWPEFRGPPQLQRDRERR